MKNLKVDIDFDKIDDILFDEEQYESHINFLISNNKIKKFPFGFEYNGITELIIEVEPKTIRNDILPIQDHVDKKINILFKNLQKKSNIC
ncbi:hypothetical protein [Treponema primitia]|uniref:hypothetical protein n=1 Tax=Treponema primitia TaxID=88058 RepID=UPI0002554DE5|nr:hypothetical protein [Treponema primitia]